nr:MFS transporter [Propionibacterium sp.]
MTAALAPAVPADQPAPVTRRHLLVVAGAASLMVFGSSIFLSAGFVNPHIARDFGVGIGQVMLYNSIMMLAGAVSTMVIGPLLLRRLGTRPTVLLAGAGVVLALLGVSVAPGLAVLYALAALLGLAFVLCTSLAATLLINTWFEARRGTMLGIVFSISGLGGVLLGLAMPPIVGAVGWRGAFVVLAGFAVLTVLLPGLLLIRSQPADVGLRPAGALGEEATADQPAVGVPGVPRGRAFRSLQLGALALGMVLYHMVQAIQQHTMPLYAERGVDGVAAGSLVSLMSLCVVGATLAVGAIADRFGIGTALWASALAQTLAMTVLWLAQGYLPLAVGTVLLSMSTAVAGVCLPLIVMLAFGPRDFAAILSPVMGAIPIGLALGTPLWGTIKDATGSYAPALAGAAVVTLVALGCLHWAIRTAPAFRARVERELDQGYTLEDAPADA